MKVLRKSEPEHKYERGDIVTVVFKSVGAVQATIVAVLPLGFYIIECEGKTATVHERFIS